MKNYFNKFKSLVLAGAATMALAGCGDFLYIEPKTFVSEDNFWNEKVDIDQMVAGTYVKMQSSDFLTRLIMWGETRSDNVTEGKGAADNENLYRVLKEDLKPNNDYTTWTCFYAVIQQCNQIIKRAPEVSQKDPTYTQSDVLATQAEMTCLRDLCYFYLVRAFKDVPYYTYAIESDSDIKPMPAVDGDSIVRCLIEDLDSVAPHALKVYPNDNTKKYDSSRARVTQNAIYALLADLCLWDGQYQRCVDYCQKVIDAKFKEYEDEYQKKSTSTERGSLAVFHNENDVWNMNGYALYPCYQDKTFGNDYNQIFGGNGCSYESIFELAFTYDGTSDNYLESGAIASLYGKLRSSSDTGQGLLALPDKITTDVYNGYYKVFDHKLDVRYFTAVNPEDKTYTEGYINKLVCPEMEIEASTENPYYANNTRAGGGSGSSYNDFNWIFYRLTDVMLMQAEALIQLGEVAEEVDPETGEVTSAGLDENLQRAFYLIWTVNRRSIMVTSTTNSSSNELKISKYQTKEAMLELCLKERQRELMFEGKRWFDLLRQCHRAKSTDYIKTNVTSKISSSSTGTLFLNYESLYWPYNKKEVRNNDALHQKPYYGSDDGTEDEFELSTKTKK